MGTSSLQEQQFSLLTTCCLYVRSEGCGLCNSDQVRVSYHTRNTTSSAELSNQTVTTAGIHRNRSRQCVLLLYIGCIIPELAQSDGDGMPRKDIEQKYVSKIARTCLDELERPDADCLHGSRDTSRRQRHNGIAALLRHACWDEASTRGTWQGSKNTRHGTQRSK